MFACVNIQTPPFIMKGGVLCLYPYLFAVQDISFCMVKGGCLYSERHPFAICHRQNRCAVRALFYATLWHTAGCAVCTDLPVFSGRKPLPCPPPASTGLNPPACATMRAARAGVAIVRQSAYAWGGGMKKTGTPPHSCFIINCETSYGHRLHALLHTLARRLLLFYFSVK